MNKYYALCLEYGMWITMPNGPVLQYMTDDEMKGLKTHVNGISHNTK